MLKQININQKIKFIHPSFNSRKKSAFNFKDYTCMSF